MDWSGCPVVEVVAGAPILKHSRVTADAVLESFQLGESVDDIAYSFDLKPDDIRDVLAYAEARQASPASR